MRVLCSETLECARTMRVLRSRANTNSQGISARASSECAYRARHPRPPRFRMGILPAPETLDVPNSIAGSVVPPASAEE